MSDKSNERLGSLAGIEELEKELIESVAHALGYMEDCGYHDMPLSDEDREPDHYMYLDLKTSLDALMKARAKQIEVSHEVIKVTEIIIDEKTLRDAIIKHLNKWTKEMEGYSYFGSNPGVSEDDYKDIIDDVLKELFGEGE